MEIKVNINRWKLKFNINRWKLKLTLIGEN